MPFELRCPSPDLGYLRDLMRIHGEHHGLSDGRLEDLVLAVNKAVTNVLGHGGRAGLITARGHQHRLTVEVLDISGRLSAEHLATATVDPTGSSGFGLWVIQHLCDEVTLEQTSSGSLLSLHFHGRPAAMIPLGDRARRGRGAHCDRSAHPA